MTVTLGIFFAGLFIIVMLNALDISILKKDLKAVTDRLNEIDYPRLPDVIYPEEE